MKIYDLLLRIADWLDFVSLNRDRVLHVYAVLRIISIPFFPRRLGYGSSGPGVWWEYWINIFITRAVIENQDMQDWIWGS